MKITRNTMIIREKIKQHSSGCFDLLKDIFSEKEIMENMPKCLLYLIMGEFDLVREDINVKSFYQWRLRYIAKLKNAKKNPDIFRKKEEERDWSIDGFMPTRYEDLPPEEEKPLIKPMW